MPSKSSSRILTDHEEIKRWAEERGAKPAAVESTGGGADPGIIRLDFPGYSGSGSLEEIEWDEWFEKFDDNNLALIVQEQTANGQKSNFNKLVSRDSVETETPKRTSPRKQPSRASSSGKNSSRTKRATSARAVSEKKASRSTSTKAGRGSSAQVRPGRTTSSRSGRKSTKRAA